MITTLSLWPGEALDARWSARLLQGSRRVVVLAANQRAIAKVAPNERNGVRSSSRLMVDKITTVPKSKVGERLGRLDDEDMVRLNQAAMAFLGLAVSPRTARQEA